MNENEQATPGEAEGDGRARHGYRNEVSWDGGQGFQPYTNQEEELGPAAAREFEGGDAGDVAGRNADQLDAVKRKPERPGRDTARRT